ncbi:MAG: tRNA nucleotidyltransferase, partial [Duncaniella sp.]|nr:tRNA nucleotidyltransferase [Duncaniella sp.]
MNSQEYHRILGYLRGLIEGTQWESHVYAVGGCCRDEIMGEPIKDIDLAIDLPGGGIGFAEWLHERNLIVNNPVTYPKFGTAMVVLKKFPDVELELVQTRKEKYTDKNSRCPETAFGSIEEDCMRRDLTVNSIFHNITSGKAVDITGRGLADIEAHLLRTPADPDVTFDDDPVRILRCIR